MNVLATNMARSIWLVRTIYLNPKGMAIVPVLSAIFERYSFAKATPLEKVLGPDNESLKFEKGTFLNKDDLPIEISLSVHDDGLVADTTSSTEDSDLFLEDILSWLSDEFKYASHTELSIKKIYLSEIYFSLNKVPNLFSRLSESFAKKASSHIENENLGEFGFLGISLGTDPSKSKNSLTVRVEREVNAPFSENRFFSSAPIQTSEHIKLLEGLELE